MVTWQGLHPKMTVEHLGLIPMFLDDEDPRPAKEQFDKNYFAGWKPFEGFTLHSDNTISYPGDPPLKPLAQCQFRNELILFYDHAWVLIVQPDRSFEACRMD